jgi:hypothetical protein
MRHVRQVRSPVRRLLWCAGEQHRFAATDRVLRPAECTASRRVVPEPLLLRV